MDKLRIAPGSFLLGMLCASLIGYTGRSTAFEQQPDNVQYAHNRYVPQILPIGSLSEGNVEENRLIDLDGRASFRDVLKNVTLVYGGGSYSLLGTTVLGDLHVELIGAAANTVHFLEEFGLMEKPAIVVPFRDAFDVPANTPIRQATKTKIKGDFVSPYDGKQ